MRLMLSGFDIQDDLNGTEILRSLEKAGRTCYKSETYITEESAKDFVAMIIKRGHETVLEHEKVTVRVYCDRGVSHEIVRHRIASYSQESTRYCNYGKSDCITFIIPSWLKDIIQEGIAKTPQELLITPPSEGGRVWVQAMLWAEEYYMTLLRTGWKPEQARSVLPNSLKTEIVMTMNLREWRHFFTLRTAKVAHPDMRAIAIPMCIAFSQRIPVIFDDLVANIQK